MALISVIVPTVGRDSITKVLEALKLQTYSPVELIVIEDLEYRGSSWARNKGYHQSRGQFVAFLDDDCVPYPDWLEKLYTAMTRFDAGAVGGTYEEIDPLYRDIQKRKQYPTQSQIDERGLVGVGGNVMYRREWLVKCLQTYDHLFDGVLSSGQDFELAFRIRDLGATFVFTPANPVHLREVSPIDFQRIQFLRGYGIYHILRCVRSKGIHPRQSSILWTQHGATKAATWLLPVIFQKVLGPFDRSHFSNWGNYFQYWLGHKSQLLGFLYAHLAKLNSRKLAKTIT